MRRSVTLGKTVVLLDGGFVRIALRESLGRQVEATDARDAVDRVLGTALFADATLLRVLYYDAPPLDGLERTPVGGTVVHFSSTPQAQHGTRLIDSLAGCEPYAVKLGEARMDGWQLTPRTVRDLIRTPRALTDADFRPVIEQRGVHMRIGLDIAWIATRRIADSLVVVTADTDFVPALEFARREGLSVVLATLGRKPHNSLRAHSDYVIDEFP
jgi:hypothetical protein